MSQTRQTSGVPEESVFSLPKKGERYCCEQCGMEIHVTADCHSDNPNLVLFECCGKVMSKT